MNVNKKQVLFFISAAILIVLITATIFVFNSNSADTSNIKTGEIVFSNNNSDRKMIPRLIDGFPGGVDFYSRHTNSVPVQIELTEEDFNAVYEKELHLLTSTYNIISNRDADLSLLEGAILENRIRSTLDGIGINWEDNIIITEYDTRLGSIEVDLNLLEYTTLPTGSIQQAHITGYPQDFVEIEDEYRMYLKQLIDNKHLLFSQAPSDLVGEVRIKDDTIILYSFNYYSNIQKNDLVPVISYELFRQKLDDNRFQLFYDSADYGNYYDEMDSRTNVNLNELFLHYITLDNNLFIPFFLICGTESFSDPNMGEDGTGRVCGGMEAIDYEKLQAERPDVIIGNPE